MSRPRAGAIVVVDWWPGQHPEPRGLRPGIVFEDSDVFPRHLSGGAPGAPHARPGLAASDLALRLEATAENALVAVSWALAHHVSSVALRKVRATPSRITDEQMAQIRQRIAVAVGIPSPR